MRDLFDPATRLEIVKRLDQLTTGSKRQWGKMAPAQMLAHCAAALEVGTGKTPRTRSLIGWILGPLARRKMLGEEPFSHDSPTDPTFVVRDERDFGAEKARLLAQIERFAEMGPAQVAHSTHSFLGRLSGEEWGRLMGKHLDHHLRQFGL